MASVSPPDRGEHVNPDFPKIKADQSLRAFRQECQLSWEKFTEVWMYICQFVSAPCNDALFKPSNPAPYQVKLAELTSDILLTGNFGAQSRGKWVFGQYWPEPHHEVFTLFIQRMAMYAVSNVMNEIPAAPSYRDFSGFQRDKVGGWLANAPWDQVRTVAPQVAESEDDSTYVISNTGASTVTRISDGITTVADTVVYQRSTASVNSDGSTTVADTVFYQESTASVNSDGSTTVADTVFYQESIGSGATVRDETLREE